METQEITIRRGTAGQLTDLIPAVRSEPGAEIFKTHLHHDHRLGGMAVIRALCANQINRCTDELTDVHGVCLCLFVTVCVMERDIKMD